MSALLTAMALWLSANFGLPPPRDVPSVRFVDPTEILVFRYRAFTPEKRREVIANFAAAPDQKRNVVAVYDEANHTVLLPVGWSGGTPAELSVLLHEMVHHLQAAAGLRYECPPAREKMAYAAQEKWLGLFNLTLASEFGLDAFTLKVATECMY